jgi:hypothetical protein
MLCEAAAHKRLSTNSLRRSVDPGANVLIPFLRVTPTRE